MSAATFFSSTHYKTWPGFAIAAAIGLLAAQPNLLGQLVNGSDTYYHIHRLWQLHSMVQQGTLFSRWVPDLAFGFGFPLFNVHGPLPYYIADLFVWLSGSLVLGYIAALVLFSVVTSIGMFLWMRDLVGEWGGLVASAAYSFAPYLISNISVRGTIAEPLAFAALPFILWSCYRVSCRIVGGPEGQSKFIWIGALALASLALNHNATLFLFLPTLVIYCAALMLWRAKQAFMPPVRSAVLHLGLMLLLGLALSAFYAVPAFLERESLSLARLYRAPELDFHNNFIPLSQMLANPPPLDVRLIGTPYPVHIGLTTVLFGIVGLTALVRKNHALTPHLIASLLIVLLCIFMMSPQSVAVWEALPIVRVLQFSRRFLPIASLYAAVLVGAGFWMLASWLQRPALKAALAAAMIAALVLTSLPLQFTGNPLPQTYAPTAESIMRLEDQYGVIATTVAGEYVPITVKEIPSITQSPLLRGGRKLDPASLPPDAKLISEAYQPFAYDLSLNTPQPFEAVFTTFYFAGWQAWLDGAPVEIGPTTPYGFIRVWVPAGQHRLQVSWGSTLLRQLSELISWLALITFVMSAFWIVRKQKKAEVPSESKPGFSEKPGLDSRHALAMFSVLVALFVFKTLIVDRVETPFNYTRFNGQFVSGLTHSANANFNNTLVFLGAELPAQAPSNGTLNATLYWRAAQTLNADYSVSLQLVDANGVIVGQSDHQHPANTPTRNWDETKYARDVHELKIYPATPPGEYALRVSVYPYGASDKPQALVNAAGVQAEAGRVQVTRPQTAINVQDVQPHSPITASASKDVLLLGYDAPTSPARPGDRVPIVLYWQAKNQPLTEDRFSFVLTPPNDAAVVLVDAPLVQGWATTQWQRGDIWRAPHTLRVPAQFASGQYRLAVQVDGAAPVELGLLTVNAPEHAMVAPAVATPQAATFGEVAELIGFDAAPAAKPGQPFEVRLVWKASVGRDGTLTPYKVFVHLLNAEGNLVAGDDAAPAQWQRPTTGWVSGEYISDVHVLNLSADLLAGNYTLQVGLYEDGGSGARLGEPVKLKQVVAVAQ